MKLRKKYARSDLIKLGRGVGVWVVVMENVKKRIVPTLHVLLNDF